jgi:D-serine deaminase-like pyridoxal phosphate-dependent protein
MVKHHFTEHIYGAENGVLMVEDLSTLDLADRFGTPLYVLSEAQIRHNVRAMTRAFCSRYPDSIVLRGIFTHAGHAYGARSPDEVRRIGELEGAAVVETANLLREHGIACPVVSVGSTPTALIAGAVPGVTEMRPGNYVFYDRMQIGLGSATSLDCSLSVLATITSRPAVDRVIIDAGSKTFALDRGAHGLESVQGFGEDPVHGLVIDHLSEEHGIIVRADHQSNPVAGERLRLLPNHACTAANLADCLLGVRGERVEEVLPVIARGGGR